MTIELSNLTFTNQADIIPASGIAEIINTGIANTLAGSDVITGTGETNRNVLFYGLRTVGLYNESNATIDTGKGNDEIIGYGNIGIFNESNATINTGKSNDKITGYAEQTNSTNNNTIGFLNDGTINTGNGDDEISGYATGNLPGGVVNFHNINTGRGDDIITGDGLTGGVSNGAGGTVNTGNGDDRIIGTSGEAWGVYNGGFDDSGFPIINTGNGDDYIIGTTTGNNAAGIASVFKGTINTNNGHDSIIGTGDTTGIICTEDGTINTGKGNDIITGTGRKNGIAIGSFSGTISSKGTISTGKGNDVITGIGGIFNDTLGIIDTGKGNDIVDAREGGFRGTGRTLLGRGKDLLRGFGSGNFEGGGGKDSLELTAGNYTVGILGATVSFTNNDGITMNTSEFEQLVAGSTMYNFTSLTDGQTITIA